MSTSETTQKAHIWLDLDLRNPPPRRLILDSLICKKFHTLTLIKHRRFLMFCVPFWILFLHVQLKFSWDEERKSSCVCGFTSSTYLAAGGILIFQTLPLLFSHDPLLLMLAFVRMYIYYYWLASVSKSQNHRHHISPQQRDSVPKSNILLLLFPCWSMLISYAKKEAELPIHSKRPIKKKTGGASFNLHFNPFIILFSTLCSSPPIGLASYRGNSFYGNLSVNGSKSRICEVIITERRYFN